MVAENDQAALEPPDVRIPPRARRIDPPLEHGQRQVQRAGDDAVPRALRIGADVHDQRARSGGLERLGRLQPVDPPARGFQKLGDPGYFANSTARLSRITVTFT